MDIGPPWQYDNAPGYVMCNFKCFDFDLLFRGSRCLKVIWSPIKRPTPTGNILVPTTWNAALVNRVTMMDYHPKTMVMVSKAEAYRTQNHPQGVRINNGWLTLDWPQTVQQRLRTSAVACRWWILRITCQQHWQCKSTCCFMSLPLKSPQGCLSNCMTPTTPTKKAP
jgi:hypothetical protein